MEGSSSRAAKLQKSVKTKIKKVSLGYDNREKKRYRKKTWVCCGANETDGRSEGFSSTNLKQRLFGRYKKKGGQDHIRRKRGGRDLLQAAMPLTRKSSNFPALPLSAGIFCYLLVALWHILFP